MATKKNTVARTRFAESPIREYAWARIAKDAYQCAETCALNKKGELPIKYFLYSFSIEVGLKAMIWTKDISLILEKGESLKEVGEERIRKDKNPKKKYLKTILKHDLIKIYNLFDRLFDEQLFANDERMTLEELNKRYKKKGFEYFDSDMILQAMSRYKDLPSIEKVRTLNKKVIDLLKEKNLL